MEPASGKANPSCQEVVDLLFDYLEEALPSDQMRALERHLESCPPCLAFVRTYKGTVAAARRLTVEEIPPQLTERLLDFLRREQAHRPQA